MMVKELPRYWRYFDVGMIISSGLVIAGVLLILLKVISEKGSIIEWISITLALVGIFAALGIGYLGTKAIKRELP